MNATGREPSVGFVSLFLCAAGVASACAPRPSPEDPVALARPVSAFIRPVSVVDTGGDDLAPLRRAIGSRRIVLLGENGHGVSEFATLKMRIVRDLHDRMGFAVVAVESGFYDCALADAQLLERPAIAAWRDCLAYTFEQAELLPLFSFARELRSQDRSFTIAGIDFQTQGTTTTTRPQFLRQSLRATGVPELADSVAAADSSLIKNAVAGGDTLRAWLRTNAREARAIFRTAASRTSGNVRWSLESAAALVDRLVARDDAERRGDSSSTEFYGLRDEWIARTVAQLTDSMGVSRKVVVWLHNDHARYGTWVTPNGPVSAAGARLKARFPNDVFSVGFFMGHGQIANNSRAIRDIAATPATGIEATFDRTSFSAGILHLTGAESVVASWAATQQTYLRNGLISDSLRPAQEFDALVYVRHVSPPSYRLPPAAEGRRGAPPPSDR